MLGDPGPVYYEGEKVNMTCNLGFHGNQPPQLEWIEPKIHVDYQHQIVTQRNTVNSVSIVNRC